MQEYCYKCMRPLGGSPVCGSCGYDNGAGQNTSVPYHLRCGTMLHGRYLIGKAIGEGGFGITYIGLDTVLSKRIAVKEFFPSGVVNRTSAESDNILITQGKEVFFQNGEKRFLLEAKNVAAFSDEEGIVDVHDYFKENGTAYIVMEYLDGENLRDYVSHYGCFDPQTLIQLMLPIMRSLGYMHSKGIIHRDISPDNIMYTKRGKLKLMDFGSARFFTNEERKMSVILKQGFAPEEQYRQNGEQGPHTDVYAMCATIYCCITGRIPIGSLDRLVSDTLLPPSRLGVRILPQQENALMHGLAVLAANRTRNMETLIKEFTSASVSAQPVNSAPVTQTPAANRAPVNQTPAANQMPYANTGNRNDSPTGFYNQSVSYPAGTRQTYANTNNQSYSPVDYYNTGAAPGGTKPPAKKSKLPIIIAAAAVLVTGCIVVLIIALNSGKSGSGGTNTQSSAYSSFASSSQASASNALYSSKGTYIITNERIDTSDSSAELKLNNYIDGLGGIKGENDELSYYASVSGNTLVYEYYLNNTLDDSGKAILSENLSSLLSSSKSILASTRSESGVSNAQMVFAYFNPDGSLIVSGICDE